MRCLLFLTINGVYETNFEAWQCGRIRPISSVKRARVFGGVSSLNEF